MHPIEELEQEIALARELINQAGNIVVLTGAGISTDSGIPDFRGPKGVWTLNPEAEKASHIDCYISDPELRAKNWKRLAEAEDSVRPEPNAGHLALVKLQDRGKLLALITQNVDGLHQDSGILPEKIIEVHGTTRQVRCLDCGEQAPMERALARVKAGEEDPDCRTCKGMLKSATISFGQALIPEDLSRAEQAALECDLVLAVGSTLEVYPVANVVPIAVKSEAKLIIVNGDSTGMDSLADVVLKASISEVLPEIASQADALH